MTNQAIHTSSQPSKVSLTNGPKAGLGFEKNPNFGLWILISLKLMGKLCFCPQGSCGGPCGPLPPNPGKTCMVEPQPYGGEPKVQDRESKPYGNDAEPFNADPKPNILDWKPNALETPLAQDVEHKPLNVDNII